jgi:hypothetical protein
MKHTDTPWQCGATPCANNDEALAIVTEEINATKTDSSGHFYVVYVGDGRRIALVGHGPDGAANAEFITRACNSYDDLFALADLIANIDECEGMSRIELAKLRMRAIDALDKTETK